MMHLLVTGILMFLISPGWSDTIKYIYVFVTYNLVNTFMYTGVCVPYNAMNCLVTKNQYERGLLGTTNVLGNVIGQILVNTFMLKLVSELGGNQTAWILAAAVFGVLGIIMHMLCFFNTTERSSEAEEAKPEFLVSVKSLFRNKYWLMMAGIATAIFFLNGLSATSTIYFAKTILHDEQAVAGLTNSMNITQMIVFFGAFIFIKKLGKGNSFKIGCAISTVAYIAQIFAGGSYTALLVCGVAKGMGGGLAASCLAGMISDSIEYGEWKTGVRCVGVGNAANTFAQKIGMGVGTALVGWLLDAAGYNAAATAQTGAALTAVKICFTYLPLACAIIALVIVLNWHLDKEYPKIIEELKKRRIREDNL